MKHQAKAVAQAFAAERTYLYVTTKAKKPSPQPPELLTELHTCTGTVDELRETNRMSPPLDVPFTDGGGGGAGGPPSLSKDGSGGGGGGAEPLFPAGVTTPDCICLSTSIASMPSLLFHVRPLGKCFLI